MRLIKQKGPHCLLYSTAMLLDRSPDELFETIGHRRTLHIQEVIDCCMTYGYGLICIQPHPVLEGVGPIDIGGQRRLDTYMSHYSGILIGESHAVAWDQETRMCYDPQGRTYTCSDFGIREFYAKVAI